MSALGPRTITAYEKLARWIATRQRKGLRVLGLNGAQGSGKSTLAGFLVEHLTRAHGLRVLAVSLDDFYLSRAAREQLAFDVHPLLITRGVPGTHEVQRGIECLRALKAGQTCKLPRFSKALDDRLAPEQEHAITQAHDLIIFEGWCVGTPPQAEPDLVAPVNALERDEDADGRWRRYVNQQLAGPYAEWFALIDALVYLQAPSWNEVRTWRAQQERETAAQNSGRSALLDDAARERFLLHYQRLTQHTTTALPRQAQAVLQLDAQHEVAGMRLADD